ncbi:MAG: cytochrome c biogenesis protein CcdA [Candidatus Brocadiia bacterium]
MSAGRTLTVATLLALAVFAPNAAAAEGFGAELNVEPARVPAGGNAAARIELVCPEGQYVQQAGFSLEMTSVEPATEAISSQPAVLPEPKRKYDRSLGMEVAYWDGRFSVAVPLSVAAEADPGDYALTFSLRYQACSPGLCLLEREELTTSLTVVGGQSDPVSPPPDVTPLPPAEGSVQDRAAELLDRSVLGVILLCYLAGLGLTLTPCIYPLIPVTISLVGATSGRGRLDGLVRSAAYVLGISMTYGVLGGLAAATGGIFGAALHHPAVYLVLAAVFALLAGAMFDWYSFDMASPRLQRLQAGLRGKGGLVGIWAIGLLSGGAASACSAPIIAAALVYVGQRGSVLLGFGTFLALGFGVGTPLIVLGTFTGLLETLPSSGEWMVTVKRVFGLALLGVALYFLGRSKVMPLVWYRAFLGAFLIGASAFVGAFDAVAPGAGWWLRLRKGAGIICLLTGAVLVVTGIWQAFGPQAGVPPPEGPAVEWRMSEPEAIAEAERTGSPVLLDFYTDHCPNCARMLRTTFRDPRVVAESRRFVCARLDLSDTGDPEVERLVDKYDIRGVPTIILRGTAGEQAAYAEYIPPERMLRLMRAVR